MTRSADFYTIFVNWLKVILPILALALLSTLFLFSGKIDVTESLPYANLNVDEIVRNQRISRPYIDAVTPTGTEVTMTAAYAKPNPDQRNVFATEDLLIRLRDPNRGAIRLSAKSGEVGPASAVLQNDVSVVTSDGVTIYSDNILVDFDEQRFVANEGMTAELDIGTLTSGRMEITNGSNGPEMIFSEGVRLLYQP